jgi:hypothetical protein
MAKDKKPRAAAPSPAGKQARADRPGDDRKQARAQAHNVPSQTPLWAFRVVDLGGRWCWSALQRDDILLVFDKLKSYESMAWAQIEGPTGSHFVEVHKLSKPARERLVEIRQDDVDLLFSLRITGRQRVWGIRDGHVLRLLWWDPEHEVCPSHLKHT